jgi:23S rRNA pseudouridine1911/1915/1917 synthase
MLDFSIHRFEANPSIAGYRLDRAITVQLTHLSRSRIQALIESGHVQLNGHPCKPSDRVNEGDIIALTEPPLKVVELVAEDIEIPMLFEDNDLIVLNKPAGLTVHPGAGIESGTVVNAMLYHCKGLSGIGGELRPGIVHRLDKETSGCLLIAKNDATHLALSRQFAGREVSKYYLALCRGLFRHQKGDVKEPIGRHPVLRQKMAITQKGRTAHTGYEVIEVLPSIGSLVLCRLFTGRTHQIRVHLHHLGHPILGDKVYGKAEPAFIRQMLHAWRLGFFHPTSKKWLVFEAELPNDFVATGIHEDAIVRTRSQLNHLPPETAATPVASDAIHRRSHRTDPDSYTRKRGEKRGLH